MCLLSDAVNDMSKWFLPTVHLDDPHPAYDLSHDVDSLVHCLAHLLPISARQIPNSVQTFARNNLRVKLYSNTN